MQKYGTADPPAYDLKNIDKVPVAMFVGNEDVLATPTDTRWEKDQMKSVVFYKEYDDYEHNSFILGNVAPHLDDLLALLKLYNK